MEQEEAEGGTRRYVDFDIITAISRRGLECYLWHLHSQATPPPSRAIFSDLAVRVWLDLISLRFCHSRASRAASLEWRVIGHEKHWTLGMPPPWE